MKILRQLTKKGDPRLNVMVPKTLKEYLDQAAKKSKRKPQDELIKRLAATFKFEEAYTLLQKILSPHLSNNNNNNKEQENEQ